MKGKRKRHRTPIELPDREIAQAESDARHKGGPYAFRDSNLKEMGFSDYQEYLGSELWKGIRKTVWARFGGRCYVCTQPAFDTHHNSYCRPCLDGTTYDFIYPVCRTCHEAIEFNEGRKRKFVRVVIEFWRRCRPAPPKPVQPPKPKFRCQRCKTPIDAYHFCGPCKELAKANPHKCACGNNCRLGHVKCRSCDRREQREKHGIIAAPPHVNSKKPALKHNDPRRLDAQRWRNMIDIANHARGLN